ncbi:MAG TPA: VOC family protein [Candidatus Dormibacteraeota bacterium]|jgi:PhnB protein|nr:VOC family protein [Candidatus Dormibacteraeota bacterium]
MSIKGAAPEHLRITPHLMVKNTKEAIAYYQEALGAEVLYLAPLPNGENMHAHLRIAQTVVMLTQEDSDPKRQKERSPGGLAAPQTLGGTTVIFELYVDDVDASFESAVNAGGTPLIPPADAFWGDRYSWILDPFGYIWALSTKKEELTQGEVQNRMEELFEKMSHGECGSRE